MEIQEFKSKKNHPISCCFCNAINKLFTCAFLPRCSERFFFWSKFSHLQWVLWSKDYPLTWWESETQKQAILWKKALQIPQILLEFPQADLRQHSVCKHSWRPVRRRHQWAPFFLLPSPSFKAGQLSWSCFVNGSGATAPLAPVWGHILSGIAVFSGDNLFFMVED